MGKKFYNKNNVNRIHASTIHIINPAMGDYSRFAAYRKTPSKQLKELWDVADDFSRAPFLEKSLVEKGLINYIIFTALND